MLDLLMMEFLLKMLRCVVEGHFNAKKQHVKANL